LNTTAWFIARNVFKEGSSLDSSDKRVCLKRGLDNLLAQENPDIERKIKLRGRKLETNPGMTPVLGCAANRHSPGDLQHFFMLDPFWQESFCYLEKS